MAEAKQVVALIDQRATDLKSELSIIANAIEGAHSLRYQLEPTLRGFRTFVREIRSYPETSQRVAERALRDFTHEVSQFRTAGSTSASEASDTVSLAVEQMRLTVSSVANTSARRYRAQVVSRASVIPKLSDLRVLNRAGHQIRADDAFFLTARKAMLDLFNEGQIAGLITEGAESVQLYHPNPEHATNGMVIAIADYAENAKLFHPRSSTIVGRMG